MKKEYAWDDVIIYSRYRNTFGTLTQRRKPGFSKISIHGYHLDSSILFFSLFLPSYSSSSGCCLFLFFFFFFASSDCTMGRKFEKTLLRNRSAVKSLWSVCPVTNGWPFELRALRVAAALLARASFLFFLQHFKTDRKRKYHRPLPPAWLLSHAPAPSSGVKNRLALLFLLFSFIPFGELTIRDIPRLYIYVSLGCLSSWCRI